MQPCSFLIVNYIGQFYSEGTTVEHHRRLSKVQRTIEVGGEGGTKGNKTAYSSEYICTVLFLWTN